MRGGPRRASPAHSRLRRRHHGRPPRARGGRALAHGLRGRARRERPRVLRYHPGRAAILAHPLFPVCYEWPLALDVRAKALPDDVAVRGVHATHRLTLHRPPRAGDRLRTTATVSALERRAPGAYLVIRMETVDAAGRPVSTTEYGSLYLGVECDAAPHPHPLPRGRGSREPSPLRGEGRVSGRMVRRGGPWTSRSPPPSPTSTRNARASGTRSTPIARSPSAPGSPTSSSTAPPRWPSPSPRRCGSSRAARPRPCAR